MTAPFFAVSHVASVVFGASVVLFGAGEFQQVLRVRRGDARSSFRDEAVFRVIFFAGILALPICVRFIPAADVGGPVIFIIGACVGWAGLLVRWWSFATLGRYFTTVVKASGDQPIIDRGPYRFVRHPSYTGLLFAFLGCGLMLGNWVGTVMSVVVIAAAVVYRLVREESALIAARGSAYLEYAEGRARLVPFIW